MWSVSSFEYRLLYNTGAWYGGVTDWQLKKDEYLEPGLGEKSRSDKMAGNKSGKVKIMELSPFGQESGETEAGGRTLGKNGIRVPLQSYFCGRIGPSWST